MKLLTIVGTRPEAVKMAPVLRALRARRDVISLLASTGQHRDLLDEQLHFFDLEADFNLDLMRPGQSPRRFVAHAMTAIDRLLDEARPDRVIVQGDTASALAGAQAAYLRGIPISHVEAGLRTYRREPWPEEGFRREIDAIADQLFAPTPLAARNLSSERASGCIHVTGNSGIDALHFVIRRLSEDPTLRARADGMLPDLAGGLPLILATLHRRENIGAGVAEICAALAEIARAGTAQVAMPIHPNPNVSRTVRRVLEGHAFIHLLPPLDYPAMVRLMQRADLILTDSGGIQEEAPTLSKPVLVLREVTERPEGLERGFAKLVGLQRDRIIDAVRKALSEYPRARLHELVASPYGDGRAAGRIVAGLLGESVTPFGDSPSEPPSPIIRLAV